jgi:hypothetical protein
MLANHPALRRGLELTALAITVWLVLDAVFAVIGTAVALAVTILVLAAIGYVLYLVLGLFSPAAAQKVRDMIRGHRPLHRAGHVS